MILSALQLETNRLEFVEDRPGHDYRYAVNFDKIKNIGWSPNTNFEDQLLGTLEWYAKNEEWWMKSFNAILENRKKRLSLD